MIKPDNGQRSAKLGNCLIRNWPRMVEQSFVSVVVWWMIDQSLIMVSARVISIDVIGWMRQCTHQTREAIWNRYLVRMEGM
jgi:hypothetical protein